MSIARIRARFVRTLGALAGAAVLGVGLAGGNAKAATITFESDGFVVAADGSLFFGLLDDPIVTELLPNPLPGLPPEDARDAMDAAATQDGYDLIGNVRYDIEVDDPDTSQDRSWFLDIFLEGALTLASFDEQSQSLDGFAIPFAFNEVDIPLSPILGDFSTDDLAAFFDPATGGFGGTGSFITNALIDCEGAVHDFGIGNCLFVPDPDELHGDFLFALDPGGIGVIIGEILDGNFLDDATFDPFALSSSDPFTTSNVGGPLTSEFSISDIDAASLVFSLDLRLDDQVGIPAPATILLFGAGLGAVGFVALRRRRRT